jgi:hypothetical protein
MYRNPFLFLSFILFFFITLSGSIIINNAYEPIQKEGYIKDFNWAIDNSPIGVHISWKVLEDSLIVGNFIKFEFTPFFKNTSYTNSLNNSLNNSYDDYSITFNYTTQSTSDFSNTMDYTKAPPPDKSVNIPCVPASVICSMPIKGPGKYITTFEITFKNTKTGEVIKTAPPVVNFIFPYESISQEEYDKKKYEKMALFFGLISLSFTIAFSSVKNLMDIWDRKNK